MTGSIRLTLALIWSTFGARGGYFSLFTSMAVEQLFRRAGGRQTLTRTDMHTQGRLRFVKQRIENRADPRRHHESFTTQQ